MKYLPGFLLLVVLLAFLSSCARISPRNGYRMNHRRAPGWHRGQGYGHGTGYHTAPKNYRR